MSILKVEDVYDDIAIGAMEEYRLEVDHGKTTKLKILSGFAEVFGTELALNVVYKISGKKIAIFSWEGCKVSFSGDRIVGYVAKDTVMTSYLNTHFVLENIRNAGSAGPRIMVLGKADTGKTSLCRYLLNCAVKQARRPIFIDLDTTQGSVSLPGTISATQIERPIDCEEEFGTTPVTTNMAPLCFYYGYPDCLEKHLAYSVQTNKLSEYCDKKLTVDKEAYSSGYIINTPAQFAKIEGLQLLQQTIEKFSVNFIVILDHDRLHHDLAKIFPDMTIVKLAISGGVVERSLAFRKHTQAARIKEYFYGTPTENGRADLNPHSTTIKFDKLAIRRIGDVTAAPSSALPLGTDRKARDTKMVKVVPGDMLLHSVLAVCHADAIPESKLVTTVIPASDDSSTILQSCIAGFMYVSEVDEGKSSLTVLAPNSSRLMNKFIVMGSLKWVEM